MSKIFSLKYEDFVDTSYRPKKDDVVTELRITASGVSKQWAAGAVAAESSIGTWTELSTMQKYVEKLRATVFYLKGDVIKIAYPIDLFEKGNMPNFLSSIAGNIFGLKELEGLRLNDIIMPRKYVRSFEGPKYGISGIRKLLGVRKRPLIGTIIKPKLGLRTADHAKAAYEAWAGGLDIVKDDENLSSQKFNKFDKRLKKTLAAKRKAERETGERKMYMINVTAETKEMLKRAKMVEDSGNEYMMVDVLTVGWSGLQTLRNEDFDLVMHAHRAMHAAITKSKTHGISMKALAKTYRAIGVDQLHTGTGVGKMEETVADVKDNVSALICDMHGLKRTMSVASGGLHPGQIPAEVKIFGNDVVIQMGGGVHGHPNGTRAGAMAARQATDAVMKGIDLKEYAKSHSELRLALEHWSKKK
jgi:ribulose-bisphosphate carboxylase large chain